MDFKSIVYFTFFALLIAAGIIAKRVFHHPEHMMLYHIPAAVFLVLCGKELTKRNQQYNSQLSKRFNTQRRR